MVLMIATMCHFGGERVVINLEESFKIYQDKIKKAEAEINDVKWSVYLQERIEAHLELLCVLGLMDQLKKVKK